MFDMSEQLLITEVNKLRRKKSQDKSTPQVEDLPKEESDISNAAHKEQLQQQPSSTAVVLEKEVTRLLLDFGSWKVAMDEGDVTVTAYILEELEGVELETPEYKYVVDYIRREFAEGNVYDDKFYLSHDDERIAKTAIELLTSPYSTSDNWWNRYKIVVPEKKTTFIKDIQSTVTRLKQFISQRELKKVDQLIKEAKEFEEIQRLMKLKMALQKQTKEFAETLGNVIYRPNT